MLVHLSPIPMPVPTDAHITASAVKNSPLAISLQTQRISGNGLALVGCSIEQDAAYWEWQIERTSGGSADDGDDDDDDDDNAPKFGVATRKDQKFYRALQAAEIDGESPSYLVAQFVCTSKDVSISISSFFLLTHYVLTFDPGPKRQ